MDDTRLSKPEYWFDRVLGDLPWGVFVFAIVSIGGLFWSLCGRLSPGAYLTAVGSGSGLLAIGHGIRTRRT